MLLHGLLARKALLRDSFILLEMCLFVQGQGHFLQTWDVQLTLTINAKMILWLLYNCQDVFVCSLSLSCVTLLVFCSWGSIYISYVILILCNWRNFLLPFQKKWKIKQKSWCDQRQCYLFVQEQGHIFQIWESTNPGN